MAVTMIQKSLIVSMFGVLSFIFGVLAEHKKPTAKMPVPSASGDGIMCKYPANPIISWEHLSSTLLLASTLTAFWSMFCPYRGKPVPLRVLFENTEFMVYFVIALITYLLAVGMLLWRDIIELFHLDRNVHTDANYECPEVEAGVYGGGALLSLASTLLWLVAVMLADNAREDFCNEITN